MTLKESINVRGLRTTVGMSKFKDFRSEHDAPVTTRVKGAGAFVMAKTNVPPMLAEWLESFKQFPPRARPASFSIDQVMVKMMAKS